MHQHFLDLGIETSCPFRARLQSSIPPAIFGYYWGLISLIAGWNPGLRRAKAFWTLALWPGPYLQPHHPTLNPQCLKLLQCLKTCISILREEQEFNEALFLEYSI